MDTDNVCHVKDCGKTLPTVLAARECEYQHFLDDEVRFIHEGSLEEIHMINLVIKEFVYVHRSIFGEEWSNKVIEARQD